MPKWWTKYVLILMVNLPFLISGCIRDTAESKRVAGIIERVEEDLQEPMQSVSEITMDSVGLPGRRYLADPEHSSISFKTRHWEIVDLIGWFEDFEIHMYADQADFTDAKFLAIVDARSIRMPNSKMQSTVQKKPYIDTDQFPKVIFRSNSFNKTAQDGYKLKGIFEINGMAKEIQFDVHYNGHAYPGEKSICGFDVQGSFDRHDFNIAPDLKLHSGKQIHGDSIYLSMSLRME